MTISVSWRAMQAGRLETVGTEISTPEEVGPLLVRLDGSFGARVFHRDRAPLPSGYADHEIVIGLRAGRGALLYSDGEIGGWVTAGDGPDAEMTYAEFEFPPDSEVSLSEVQQALTEFLATRHRPTCVRWQRAE